MKEEIITKIEKLIKTKRFTEAIEVIDLLLKEDNVNVLLLKMRCEIHEKQKEYELAIRDITVAISLSNDDEDLLFARGRLYFMCGLFEESIIDFSKIIEMEIEKKSNFFTEVAYFFRADSYLRLKQYQSALNDCKFIRHDGRIWTDKLRFRKDIVDECNKQMKRV